MINKWIEKNIKELQKICRAVSRTTDSNDLCQICIEQFLTNKKVKTLPEDSLLYFFTKIVQNNYYSKSSQFYYTYNKFKFSEQELINETADKEYEESPITLEWVREELKEMDWYSKRLFELFIEENCSISKLSLRTTIPINSVSRDINKVRRELIKKRNKKLDN